MSFKCYVISLSNVHEAVVGIIVNLYINYSCPCGGFNFIVYFRFSISCPFTIQFLFFICIVITFSMISYVSVMICIMFHNFPIVLGYFE